MESLKEILNVDISNYMNEGKEINERIKRTLGSSFSYALSENKRFILYAVVKHYDPETVIETGVGPGVSTTITLSALRKGVLYSIDVRRVLENGEPVGFLVPEELRNKWKLYIGKSSEILPKVLNQLGSIDIFLHDSEHTFENVMSELNIVWDHLKNGGLLFIDNLDFTEAPYYFAREKGVKLYKLTNEAGGLGLIIKK